MIITSGLTNQASASTATEVEFGSCVTEIDGGTFIGCQGLTEVEIPNTVTRIGSTSGYTDPWGRRVIEQEGAFLNCANLSSVTIGSGITKIGYDTFSGCTNITSLRINAITPPDLGSISFNNGTFEGNYLIYVPNEAYNSYITAFSYGWDTYKDRIAYDGIPYMLKFFDGDGLEVGITICGTSSTITTVDVPSGATRVDFGDCVTSVNSNAFRGKGLLISDIPSGITSIGRNAFASGNTFSSLTLSSSLSGTSIGDTAFRGNTIDVLNLNSNYKYDYGTYKGWNLFSYSTIGELNIGNNVTGISEGAFAYCSGNTNIVIPSSVTYIQRNAFNHYNKINSLVFEGDCSFGANVFEGATISSVTLNNIVSGGSSMFYGATITRMNSNVDGVLNVPNGKIEYNFLGNSSGYTTINIPSGVTYIGDGAFENCQMGENLELGNVTHIGVSAFDGCNIKKVSIIGDSGLTLEQYSFRTSSLTEVYIENMLSAYTAFGSDSSNPKNYIEKFGLGSGITSVQSSFFKNFTKLKEVNLSSSVTSIESNAFYNAFDDDFKPRMILPNTISSIGESAFENSKISAINIPTSLTSIGNRVFRGCSNLSSITIPSNILAIGDMAFYAANLSELIIPSNVASIGGSAFTSNYNMTSIIVNRNTPPTIGARVFDNTNNCPIYVPSGRVDVYKEAENWSNYASRIVAYVPKKLRAVYSDGSVNSIDCDGATALTSASTLNYVKPYSAMTSAVIGDCITSIGNNAFSNCNNLSSVTIPSSVTTIGDFVFYRTSALERIDIPSSVTSIGYGALSHSGVKEINIEGSGLTELPSDFAVNCYSLSSVTIPSGVTAIGRGAFYGCSSLSSVTIPNGVGGIQQDAFNGCSNLKTLTLPESIEVLRNGTFMNCDNLESVTLEARLPRQVPYVETDVSNPTFSLTASYPFYVNSNLVSYFKNDTYWSAYADRIFAIPS